MSMYPGIVGSLLAVVAMTACSPKVSVDVSSKKSEAPVHLTPDATTPELKNAVQETKSKTDSKDTPAEDQAFYDSSYKMGERLNKWIANINAHLPEGQRLALWSPGSLSGTPIDATDDRTHYSIPRVQARIDAIKKSAPAEMIQVIFGTDEIPNQTSIPFDTFITSGRLIDKAYQTAMRLQAMAPYRDYYSTVSKNDLRGYYFLNQLEDRQTKLAGFANLASEDQIKIKEWLTESCMNNHVDEDADPRPACAEELKKLTDQKTDLNPYYNQYFTASQALWDSYFQIPADGVRKDVTWTAAAPNVLSIPFMKTALQKVNDYLSVNIQDEWKWGAWQLLLSFQDTQSADTPHVEFKPGALPHVNGVGGNIITMDGNADLDAWDAQWTIRHEFGHVMGFVDCYIEFYDVESKEMVNYQLDVSNLMCSRKGIFKEHMFDELKRVYFKN